GDQAAGPHPRHRPRHRLCPRRLRRPPRPRRPQPPAVLTIQIFHIATASDWTAAQRSGTYTTSTRGRTLEQEGFIHASRREQVAGVWEAVFADAGAPPVLLQM